MTFVVVLMALIFGAVMGSLWQEARLVQEISEANFAAARAKLMTKEQAKRDRTIHKQRMELRRLRALVPKQPRKPAPVVAVQP